MARATVAQHVRNLWLSGYSWRDLEASRQYAQLSGHQRSMVINLWATLDQHYELMLDAEKIRIEPARRVRNLPPPPKIR